MVKLQAAVRGHMVRRHAVGTLHCVQAIVKMQTLVRARYACLGKEPDWKAEEDTCNSVTSVMQLYSIKHKLICFLYFSS